MTPRIVVTTPIPEPAAELLRTAGGELWISQEGGSLPTERLHEVAQGAHAIVANLRDRVDAELVEAAGEQLRVVANIAVGYDNVDVPALAERNVQVTNTPGVLTDATADLAFALLLMVTRRLGEGERLIRDRQPWSFELSFMLGSGLRDKLLGLIGFGQIGQAMARRARASGMRIAYAARNRVSAEVEAEFDAVYLSRSELLERADVVSLHCPLTSETRGMIDAHALRAMRADAFLVNTSRGQVVDESALVTALRQGWIAGAALDVFEREPEVAEGLLELDNAVLIPHLGSATVETRTEMASLAARNVLAVLAGRPALTPVWPNRTGG
ncbi:lactate dehydrogenase-like 2-hydroxyacid dehydrogenase [Tamaricihabitans halophyticus]|uniref:Lactate dehydrogenase-like 2-hydroxyacid dehydrogenase n=1 Tax=Tamaricihabitans halophyticus TaxID=1262583 RepID=A0A4R2PXB7_9PSEU|nr:D-glycerate dehydrogenase [Tamaricihabitans halophyticus]TCP40677.1 lactate dehydrogenase-like 2-hydroxyacid dehydrogenase [Tamaricihabitans halophyticus]